LQKCLVDLEEERPRPFWKVLRDARKTVERAQNFIKKHGLIELACVNRLGSTVIVQSDNEMTRNRRKPKNMLKPSNNPLTDWLTQQGFQVIDSNWIGPREQIERKLSNLDTFS
jgi:hypothetical protein